MFRRGNVFFHDQDIEAINAYVNMPDFEMENLFRMVDSLGDAYLKYNTRKLWMERIGARPCGAVHSPFKLDLLASLRMNQKDVSLGDHCKLCLFYFFKECHK